MAVGKGVLAAAPFQVAVGRHEGGEAESGLGHPADKGMGFGQGPGAGEGRVPLVAKIPGQRAEPDDGEGAGHFAAEGVDATSQVVHWLRFSLRGLFGDFSIPRTFPDISGHFLPLRAAGGVGMGITNGAGSFMGIGYRVASVAGWVWV